MSVPVGRPAGFVQQELPGHLEMKDQAHSIFQGDDQIFAPAAELQHPAPPQPPQPGRPAALQQMSPQQAEAGNPPAGDAPGQAASYGLDFREFRHAGILAQFRIS